LSYGKKNRIEPLRWYGQTILPKCQDITLNGFTDVLHGIFFGFSLANASWQAGAFRDPVAIFTGI